MSSSIETLSLPRIDLSAFASMSENKLQKKEKKIYIYSSFNSIYIFFTTMSKRKNIDIVKVLFFIKKKGKIH